MSTYTLNAPHTKAELSNWSQDLRREYLTGLMQRYCPTDSQLADMLGCSKSTVYNILTAYSVSRGNHRQTHAQRDAWLRFLSPDAPERDESDVSPEAIPAPEEHEVPADAATEPQAGSRFPFDRLSITLTGKPAHSLERLWQLFSDVDDELELTITAVRKGVV